jgi:hypothetical protein
MTHLFSNTDMLKHILRSVPDAKGLGLVAHTNKNLHDVAARTLQERTEGNLFAMRVPTLLTSLQFPTIFAGIQKFSDLEEVQEKIFQIITLETDARYSDHYLISIDNRDVFSVIMSKYPNNKPLVANICTLFGRMYSMASCAKLDTDGDILKYGGNLLDALAKMSDEKDTVVTVLHIFREMMDHHKTTTQILQESGQCRDVVWVAFHILEKYGCAREYDPETKIIEICIDMVLPIYDGYQVLNNMPPPTTTILKIIRMRELDFECQLDCCSLLQKTKISPEHVPECFLQVARMLDRTHLEADPMFIEEYFDHHTLVLATLKSLVCRENTMDSCFLMSATCGMQSLFYTLVRFQTKGNDIDTFSPESNARQLIVDDACCIVWRILQCNNMSSHFQKLIQTGTLELLMHTIEYQMCDPHPHRAQPALVSALEALTKFLISARSRNPSNVLPVADLTFDINRMKSLSPHLHGLPVAQFVYFLYNNHPLPCNTSGLGYSKVHSCLLYMMYIFLDGKLSVDLTRANVPQFSIAELLNTTNNLFQSALTGTQSKDEQQEYKRVAMYMDSIVRVFTEIDDINLSDPIASRLYEIYKQLRIPYEQK